MATQAGTIFGTARYISPEGAQGTRVGAAGDVYSLATMLFQCLAGDTPFDGESPVAILLKHTSEPAPDVRSRHRSSYVPEPVARVIAANLAKSAGDRCRDAREFGKAIVEAARAAGLSPDELVLRSTLVGAGRSGFSLQSMERTKQMNLSPEAQSKMAEGGRASATELMDKPHPASNERASSNGHPSNGGALRSSAEPLESAISSSGRVAKTRADRDSGIEPTLSDEPANDLGRASAGSLPPHTSFPPTSSLPTPRPSSPSLTGHGDEAGPLGRRWVAIFACFVVGVALSAFVAHRLGAFAQHESPVEAYAKRARQALAVGAFDEPPQENVKQITDTALDRWPDAPSIVAVRRDAARSATERARALVATDRTRAEELAELARHFDPDYEPARRLLANLSAQPSEPAAPPPPSAPSASTRSAKPKLPRGGSAPAAVPPPPQPAAEPAPAPAPSSTGGGRWL
jgi:serine/threonine-protein kinase